MKIIAEIIGYTAVLGAFILFQQTDRKRLIFCKLILDFLWIVHFVMIGGYTTACTAFISIFRELVFVNCDKPFFKGRIWLWIFIALYAVTPIFTWRGICSIFPAMASMGATVSFWVKSVKTTKKIALLVAMGQLVYEIAVNSYAAITNELVTIASILISFFRGCKNKG